MFLSFQLTSPDSCPVLFLIPLPPSDLTLNTCSWTPCFHTVCATVPSSYIFLIGCKTVGFCMASYISSILFPEFPAPSWLNPCCTPVFSLSPFLTCALVFVLPLRNPSPWSLSGFLASTCLPGYTHKGKYSKLGTTCERKHVYLSGSRITSVWLFPVSFLTWKFHNLIFLYQKIGSHRVRVPHFPRASIMHI